ncbi:MAG: SDR family oxidoreductase [Actinomycetota bacterium]|nr:SDR family oxidoreductase [Actinomycetota bacterium]
MHTDRQRALVTGGAGFLGSHVCASLLSKGHDVVCLDNFVTGSQQNIDGLMGEPGFTLLDMDLSEDCPDAGEVDLVLHLASPASPVQYAAFPIETLRVGSHGTWHALDAARRCGARFVLASTSEVYGDAREHPQRETYWGNVNPIGPRAVYDEAKRFAEALTMSYRRTHHVNTGIVRIFNTYGPSMRADDGRVVSTFIRQALDGEPLTVAGDGRQTRSLCYIDDTVDAIIRMGTAHCPGPVNIGNPHEISVLDLAQLVLDLTGSTSDIEFVELGEDDPRRRCPDVTAARDVLGWEPMTSLEVGLRRTVQGYVAARLAQDPLWSAALADSEMSSSAAAMTSSAVIERSAGSGSAAKG